MSAEMVSCCHFRSINTLLDEATAPITLILNWHPEAKKQPPRTQELTRSGHFNDMLTYNVIRYTVGT